jgi:hypothetical protein
MLRPPFYRILFSRQVQPAYICLPSKKVMGDECRVKTNDGWLGRAQAPWFQAPDASRRLTLP